MTKTEWKTAYRRAREIRREFIKNSQGLEENRYGDLENSHPSRDRNDFLTKGCQKYVFRIHDKYVAKMYFQSSGDRDYLPPAEIESTVYRKIPAKYRVKTVFVEGMQIQEFVNYEQWNPFERDHFLKVERELESLGFSDLHSGNMVWDRDAQAFKLIDFGFLNTSSNLFRRVCACIRMGLSGFGVFKDHPYFADWT